MEGLKTAEQDEKPGAEERYSQDPCCTGQESDHNEADKKLGAALDTALSLRQLNYTKRGNFDFSPSELLC
jgi:hypothetical protein